METAIYRYKMTLRDKLTNHIFTICLTIIIGTSGITYSLVDVLLLKPRDLEINQMERIISELRSKSGEVKKECAATTIQTFQSTSLGDESPVIVIGKDGINNTNYHNNK